MRIKFLGTSAGWPLPRLGCNCEICTSPDPKNIRTRTQILIDNKVLLDAGPETYLHLIKEKNILNLEAILISHEHPDHILGLWDLPHIYGRKENNLNKIRLYITQPVLNGIKRIFKGNFGPIDPIIVEAHRSFSVGSAKITYLPVVHGKTPAYAIKYQDGKVFTYITDFNKIPPSSQNAIKGSNILALDGSSLNKLGQTPGHISIEDGIKIGKDFKAKSIYFVHIGHKTGTHEFLENYLKEKAGPNFHIAFDGLELKL